MLDRIWCNSTNPPNLLLLNPPGTPLGSTRSRILWFCICGYRHGCPWWEPQWDWPKAQLWRFKYIEYQFHEGMSWFLVTPSGWTFFVLFWQVFFCSEPLKKRCQWRSSSPSRWFYLRPRQVDRLECSWKSWIDIRHAIWYAKDHSIPISTECFYFLQYAS